MCGFEKMICCCFEFLLIEQIEICHTKFPQFSDDQNLAREDLPMPKSWPGHPRTLALYHVKPRSYPSKRLAVT